jgi:hypothetical protein
MVEMARGGEPIRYVKLTWTSPILTYIIPAVIPAFDIDMDADGKMLFPKVKDSSNMAGAIHSYLIAKYSKSFISILPC